MKIAICGPSGSGKSTLQNYICENYRYDIGKTETTRAPRESDNGCYEYVSYKDMLHNIADAKSVFLTEYSGNFYAVPMVELNKDNTVFVLDYNGIVDIKSSYGDEVVTVCLDANEDTCKYRMAIRGDSYDSIKNRIATEPKIDDYAEVFIDIHLDAEDSLEYNTMEILKKVFDIGIGE